MARPKKGAGIGPGRFLSNLTTTDSTCLDAAYQQRAKVVRRDGARRVRRPRILAEQARARLGGVGGAAVG